MHSFSTTLNMEQLVFLSKYKPDFEAVYIEMRKKERRLLSDEQVKHLPHKTTIEKSINNEWKLRAKTFKRFSDYVSKNSFKNILDLGCGNGWFSNKLAAIQKKGKVTGLDMNKQELEQAVRIFGNINPV